MLAEDTSHVRRSKARFQMKAYYAPQFAALRRLCIEDGEESYLTSIGRCKQWSAQGGKSNVFFAKTHDNRYIIKQTSRVEKQSFLHFAPDYLSYLSHSIQNERATCLAKVLGMYRVRRCDSAFVFVLDVEDLMRNAQYCRYLSNTRTAIVHHYGVKMEGWILLSWKIYSTGVIFK